MEKKTDLVGIKAQLRFSDALVFLWLFNIRDLFCFKATPFINYFPLLVCFSLFVRI